MRPTGFEVEFKYKCPRCNSVFYVTSKEAKTKGFKIACCHTITLDTIKNVFVRVSFLDKNKEEDIVKGAFDALKSLDYPYKLIEKFQGVVEANTKEELVKKFLAFQEK